MNFVKKQTQKVILCITPVKHLKGVYEEMNKYGSVIYKPDITEAQLVKVLSRNKKINIIYCNPNRQNFKLEKKNLNKSSLKAIFTASTGTNHIDIDYCKSKKIKIISYKKDKKIINKLPSTSELAVGLMIGLIRNIPKSFDAVKKKKWDYYPFIGRELNSLTIGIIGYGRLGKFMAKFCKGLGLQVLISDPYVKTKKFKTLGLQSLINKCDILSLHVHINDDTIKIINKNNLLKSNKKPYIINTSRGEVVNEKDIYHLLRKKKISGYATDVLEHEFESLNKSYILKGVKENLNIIVTPHIGGMTFEGSKRAWMSSMKKLKNIN